MITTTTHPFGVGRMVYETADEAIAKAQYASDQYGVDVPVVIRATGEVLVTVTPSKVAAQ